MRFRSAAGGEDDVLLAVGHIAHRSATRGLGQLDVGDDLSGQIASYVAGEATDDQGNVIAGEGAVAADDEGNVAAAGAVAAGSTE